jgi:hypothetical protein
MESNRDEDLVPRCSFPSYDNVESREITGVRESKIRDTVPEGLGVRNTGTF